MCLFKQPSMSSCTSTVNNCGCGGSCNNIEAPYASVCVSVKVKNMDVNVFNLKL